MINLDVYDGLYKMPPVPHQYKTAATGPLTPTNRNIVNNWSSDCIGGNQCQYSNTNYNSIGYTSPPVTTVNADEIVVLDGGTVAQQGIYKELANDEQGFFFRMVHTSENEGM